MSTYLKINLYSGDKPSIFIGIDNFQMYTYFNKLKFHYVNSSSVLLPCDGDDPEEYGNPVGKSWSWWLVINDKYEISCYDRGMHGIRLSYADKSKGLESSIKINENQAIELYNQLEREFNDNTNEQDIENGQIIYKPFTSVIRYNVDYKKAEY